MALKISNTTVIDNLRALQNISSVDATTHHFLLTNNYTPDGATFVVLTKSTETATGGVWTKSGGSAGDYVVAYLVGGGGSGSAIRQTLTFRAYAEGGHSGAAGIAVFGYGGMASTVNYKIGDGGAAVTSTTNAVPVIGNLGGDTVFYDYGVGSKTYKTKMGLATTEGSAALNGSTDYVIQGGYVDNSYMYDQDPGTAFEIKYENSLASNAGNMRMFQPSSRKPDIRTGVNGGVTPWSNGVITAPGSPAVVGAGSPAVVRTGYNRTYNGVFPNTGTGGNGTVSTTATAVGVDGGNFGAGGGGAITTLQYNATSGAGAPGCIILMIMPGVTGISSALDAVIRIPSFAAVVAATGITYS